MAVLEVKDLGKSFGKTAVLENISFSLDKGETIAIIGSSGSGKTTLLRCLNFLTTPDRGSIAVNGETLFDAADPATAAERQIRRKRLHFGLVFQNFNLIPQYTALQNVSLAPELLAKERPDYKQNKKEILARIRADASELLDRVGSRRSGSSTRTSSPAASASAWPSRGRWRCGRTCCASTSRPPRSTPSSRARC